MEYGSEYGTDYGLTEKPHNDVIHLPETLPLKAVNQGQGHQPEVKVKPADLEEGQSEGWKEAWYNFSQSTTLHGVNRITEPSPYNVRRLLWLLVILLGVTLFVKQVVQSVTYYLEHPVTVNVKINYNKTLTFPAVTLCNQNDFRTTATASRGLYKLVEQYYGNLRTGGTNLTSYNATHLPLDYLYNQTAHRKDDMIIKCEWDEDLCSEDDFQEIFTDYGRCFTFNLVNEGRPLRKVRRTGADRGLRLLLNIEQYEYMLGPNPGAGVKILIHENTEIPSVRDLGHAIPPGTHAYVGIQITKVSNLKPPHGKCNDTVNLRYFQDYSVPACIQECKADFLSEHCGCRDFYMEEADIHGTPAPPVCTLGQYQDCADPLISTEFYRPLPDGRERCDCPIACTRLMFDPTISYATTSTYDTMVYKRSDRARQLYDRFLTAREVFQRVDDHELTQNEALITSLNATTRRVAVLIDTLSSDVTQVSRDLTTYLQRLKKRTWFHNHWGVQKVKYIVHQDFVRGWEVIDERTFSLVTDGYKEMVAYVKHVVHLAYNESSNMTSFREALYISADRDLYAKSVLCARALDNMTLIENGFLNSTVILTYLASPGRRYDLTWVSPSVINQPKAENYIKRFRQRTERYCNQIEIFRSMLKQMAYDDQNEIDIDEVAAVGNKLEAAARSFNYYRYTVYDRVVLKTEEAADKIVASFVAANQSMMEDYVRLDLGLNDVLSFLDRLKTSWNFMMKVNEQAEQYVHEETNKTALADLIFSEDVMEARRSLKSYFAEARIRSNDLATFLKRFRLALFSLWRNMIGEVSTQAFYKKVHEDVTAAQNNETALNALLHAFSYMTKLNKTYVKANLGELYVRMNADFPSLTTTERLIELGIMFQPWFQQLNIGGTIGDLDAEFFNRLNDLAENLKAFVEVNQLNDLFFAHNFMSVDVFMKELSYEEIEQQVAYDLTSLWSDIGGSMGLFIGASVITGFEFIDVIVLNIVRLHCRRREKKGPHG